MWLRANVPIFARARSANSRYWIIMHIPCQICVCMFEIDRHGLNLFLQQLNDKCQMLTDGSKRVRVNWKEWTDVPRTTQPCLKMCTLSFDWSRWCSFKSICSKSLEYHRLDLDTHIKLVMIWGKCNSNIWIMFFCFILVIVARTSRIAIHSCDRSSLFSRSP